MKNLFTIICVSLIVGMSACTSIHKTTKQPYSHVQLERGDFDLSKQKTANATAITILGIDFERLFMKKTGSDGSLAASLPIVGQYLADPTTSYAMYNLLFDTMLELGSMTDSVSLMFYCEHIDDH